MFSRQRLNSQAVALAPTPPWPCCQQVLEAATLAVRDEYQRNAIQSTLADDNLNKRVAWMNRVLGSLYVDDDMVLDEEGEPPQRSAVVVAERRPPFCVP
jgi:hypothetical protein